MSNPNDPKPTNPDDPADDKAKGEPSGNNSSYEFNLDVQSYSDLPPVPQPEANDGTLNQAALPPRPSARRPTQGSFDFIDLDSDMAALSDPDVQLPPVPPLLTPTPNAVNLPPAATRPPVPPLLTPTPIAIDLPPLPAAPEPLLAPTESVIAIPPAPRAPSTDIVIDLPPEEPLLTPTPNAVDIPPAPSAPVVLVPTPAAVDLRAAGTAADISTLYPTPPASSGEVNLGEPVAASDDDSGSFAMAAGPAAAPAVPSAVPMPSEAVVELPPMVPVAFTMSSAEIDLPPEPAGQPPLLTPTPNAVDIPPAPSAPVVLVPTPNAVDIPPAPSAPVVLVPTPAAVDLRAAGTAADISTLYPTPPASDEADLGKPADGSGSFVMTGPVTAPRVPPAVPVPSEDAVHLPPTIPVAFTMSSADIDLPPEAPSGEVPLGFAASLPDIDLSSVSGTDLTAVPEGVAASLPDIDLDPPSEPTAVLPVPDAFAASLADVDLPEPPQAPRSIPSGAFATAADLAVEPPADPSSQAARTVPIPDAIAASVANVDLPDSGAVEPVDIPMAFAASSAEIDLGDLPEAESLEPPSATLNVADLGAMPVTTTDPSSATIDVTTLAARAPQPEPPSVPDVSTLTPPLEAAEVDLGAEPPAGEEPSSFTLGSEAAAPPPVRMPSEPSISLLLPPPVVPGTDPSLTSMGSMGSIASLSVPDISILFPADAGASAGPVEPPKAFVSPDNAMADLGLSPVPPDATASSVDLGRHRPVAPSADWLDSGLYDVKRTDPDVVPPAPAVGADTSDIFTGRGAASASPGSVEHSDVIAATAGLPPDGARPSELALTFDGPPGGSTLADIDSDDLPLAEEGSGSSAPIGRPRADDESIHDLTVPDEDPLFDSERLADVRDLPADAPNFGAPPVYSADASSILGGHTDPSVDLGSESSVSVERPGMDGTLTGGPADEAFDLTAVEIPVPEGLFDDEPVMPPSGSDLFEGRTSADLDLNDLAGRVEPVDPSLTADQPSLTSDPRSIFAGGRAGAGGSDSAALEPTDPELEEAEFTDHPTNDIRRTSSGDFELPDVSELTTARVPLTDDDGGIDWNAVSENEDATRGTPRDTSLSALIREQMEEANDNPTHDAVPVTSTGGTASGPEVSVDWVTGSSEQSPVLDDVAPVAPPRGKKPPRKPEPEPDFAEAPTKTRAAAKDKKKAAAPARLTDSGTAEPSELATDAKKKSRETRSLFTGVLLGGLLAAGVTAGAFLATDNKPGAGPGTPLKPLEPPVVAKATDPLLLLTGGDASGALKALPPEPKTAEEKATDGAVRLFAKAQALDGKAAADDADLKAARDSLSAAVEAADKEKNEKAAALATVRLGVAHQLAGNTAEARDLYKAAQNKYKSFAPTFEALLAKLEATEAGVPGALNAPRRLTPAEAERLVLALTVLLAQEPKDPPKADEPEEAGVHYWQAVKLAKDGKFDEAIKKIDEAKAAHVKRARALAGRGLNPLTDPLEEMFPRACDEMKVGWAARRDYAKSRTELTATKTELAKVGEDLKAAKADVVKATKDFDAAKTELTKATKDLEDAKGEAAKLDKEYKLAKAARDEAETKLGVANKELKASADDLKAAQADAKAKGDTLAKVAAELKPVKALPANPKEDELLAVVKSAAGLASGDMAKELLKAQEAAKAAQDKLVADTKALNAKYDADTKKLKDDAAADLKKQKDAGAEEVIKLTEKYTADAKKAADAAAAALKIEQDKTDAERKSAAAQAIAFQKQLANAITPAQGLDLWLPVLADLRRSADADPAMALAAKALESSAPGSEDAAKARTTTGMGLLLKGDYANAKVQFQLAVRSAAYEAAKAGKGKYWTTVADNGLEATDDPVALYRRPVVIPPVDPRAAAKALDTGISAYKARRYDAAVTALQSAAKNDPSDPVSWYYLGAVRYAQNDAAQAEKDIAQGGERERNSSVPGRTVSDALAPIQGRARAAIDKARP